MKIKIIVFVIMVCMNVGLFALDVSYSLSTGDCTINASTPLRDSRTWAIGLRQDFSQLPIFLELSGRSNVIPYTVYDANGDGNKWSLIIPGVGLRSGWTLKLAETGISFPLCISLVASFPGDKISDEVLASTTGNFSFDFGASFSIRNFTLSIAVVSRLMSADTEGRFSSIFDDPVPGLRGGLSVGL